MCWRAYPEDFQFSGERAATLLIGQEGSLGRTSLRYLRRLIWRRLQVSMIERMAAIFGPASWLPICSQFLTTERQGTHRVLYAEMVIMPRSVHRGWISRGATG